MCFLRPARGFGWLDPRLNRSTTTSSRSHHHAHSNANQTQQDRLLWNLDAGECDKSLGVVGIDDEGLWKTILCIYLYYLHSMMA
jgi:hypothetical protein